VLELTLQNDFMNTLCEINPEPQTRTPEARRGRESREERRPRAGGEGAIERVLRDGVACVGDLARGIAVDARLQVGLKTLKS